jgi:hypothetical protein
MTSFLVAGDRHHVHISRCRILGMMFIAVVLSLRPLLLIIPPPFSFPV